MSLPRSHRSASTSTASADERDAQDERVLAGLAPHQAGLRPGQVLADVGLERRGAVVEQQLPDRLLRPPSARPSSCGEGRPARRRPSPGRTGRPLLHVGRILRPARLRELQLVHRAVAVLRRGRRRSSSRPWRRGRARCSIPRSCRRRAPRGASRRERPSFRRPERHLHRGRQTAEVVRTPGSPA